MKLLGKTRYAMRQSGFPPHSCGGLIEAEPDAPASYPARAVFPRIRAGASLKRDPARLVPPVPLVFPRIRAGASLKQARQAVVGVRDGGFPPHSCGGLIEAVDPRARADVPFAVFPRIRAGASLKHRRAEPA